MRYLEYRDPSLLEQSLRIQAIPSKKTDTVLINYLTQVEMEAVLNAPSVSTRIGIRDRAMLHVSLAAGLRVSELTGLLLSDLALQPVPTIRITGKGRKQRALPLWKQAAVDLRAWLAIRGNVAIDSAEQQHHTGDATDQPQWPEPPDLLHQEYGGIRAAQNLLLREQQAHLRQWVVVRKVEAGFDPRRLQWNEVEATPEQGTFNAPQPTEAERAFAVITNPTSGGLLGDVI